MTSLLVVCTTVLVTQGNYLSHPPLRLNPPPSSRPLSKGPAFYVDAAKGDDANDGSKDSPCKTINHALMHLRAGETLLLRGGTYFENVRISLVGTKQKPIVIRSYPGEQATIDGGIPDFQLSPADTWEPFSGGGKGEFRSKRAYPNIRDVVGAFGDSDIGLQTYWHLIDLRSPHELTAPGANDDVRPQYCGPGIYYDRQSGHIHVRLAHTHFKYFDNYRGETDPRKLPLVIAPFRSTPLWVDHAKHVKFQDLIIRGGGYETTKVTYGVDIDFDNVTIRGGTYAMRTENTGPFRFYRSAMYGNAPPWSFRGDGSLRARPGQPRRDIARLTCHALWVTDTGREFSVYAFPVNDDWEVAYSEFTDSHDGLYLGGINMRFHHNLVDLFQDDGNPYWSPGSETTADTFFNRYRKSPAFESSKAVYAPGFTSNSLAADPRFVKAVPEWPAPNDYRLEKGSPAINTGAALPADWPDSRKGRDPGKPDIGALPDGANPFTVGRSALP